MATYIEDLVQNIYTNCDMSGLDKLNKGLQEAIMYSGVLESNLRKANMAQREGFNFHARAIDRSKEAYQIERQRQSLEYQQARYRNKLAEQAEIIDERRKKRLEQQNFLQKNLVRWAMAYFSLRTLKGVVDNYRSLDLTRRSIEGLTKSTQDWDYIQKEAFRTATDIEVVAKGYRNFYSATSMAGVDKNSIQTMYSGILESGRAIGATQQQIQGALLAMEQMYSKGRVSMEELRRQLGNALPGAFEIAAKAMGVTTEQFNELIKSGVRAADLVPRFVEQYRKTFGKSFPEAMKSLDAALVNLSNSWKLLQYDFLKGEAGRDLAKLIVQISKTLQSPRLKQSISFIAKTLSLLLNLLRYVVINIEAIMWLIAPIVGGFLVKKLWDVTKALYTMVVGLNGAQTALFKIFLIFGWIEEIIAFFTDKEGLLETAIMGKDQSWIERLTKVLFGLGLVFMTLKGFKNSFANVGKAIGNVGTKVAGTATAIGATVSSKSKSILPKIGGSTLGFGAIWASLANMGNQQISKMGINPMSVSPYGFAVPYNTNTPTQLSKTETIAPTITYSPKYEINASSMTPEQLRIMLDERDRNFWMSLLNPATMLFNDLSSQRG